MIRSLTLSFLSLFFFATTSLAAIQEIEGQTVENIIITPKGTTTGKKFDRQAILMRLKTTVGHPFSQDDFDQDIKLLSRDYYKVEPSVKTEKGKLTVFLELHIKPSIRSINIFGNEQISAGNIRRELDLKIGHTFDRKAFTEAFNNIKAFYVRRGHFEAKMDYSLSPDPNTNEIDIDIHITEGRSGRIKGIEFVGFTKAEEKILSKQILTKKYHLLTSWATGEGTYRKEMIQQDELQVADFLQNQGYADARVSITTKESGKNNRIVIEITTEKGQRYTFGAIEIEGNDLVRTEDILSRIAIKEGGIFSPQILRESSATISKIYGKHGYIDTYAVATPHLDPEKPVYNVHVQVREGEQYRIGTINVYGNTATTTSVILNEALLIPGEVFDSRKLQQTEQRLMAIGYFEGVNVYPVPTSHSMNDNSVFRDVNIEVVETSTGSFSASAGFSTMESIFGAINLSEKNFNWRGVFDLYHYGLPALRGAGEYAYISAMIGKTSHRYSFSWAKPYFYDTRWTVGFEIDQAIIRLKNRGFDTSSYGLRVYGMYQINEYVFSGLHYRLRHSDNTIPSDERSDAEQQRAALNDGTISAVGASLNYDSTNNSRRPTDGFRSRLEVEYAGLGGESHFSSVSYLNSLYYGISDCNILKFRADARFIMTQSRTPFDQLPQDERFYMGGETTVRGYRPYAIGPKYSTGSPKGGISQSLFSVEYRYLLHDRVDLFTFVDVGSVSMSSFTFGPHRASVGVGAQLSILPTAPLVIGYGIPINPANKKDDEKRFYLSMGGTF